MTKQQLQAEVARIITEIADLKLKELDVLQKSEVAVVRKKIDERIKGLVEKLEGLEKQLS